MRRTFAVATGIAAGLTSLALVATPALAQAGRWSADSTPDRSTCPMRADASDAGYGMSRGPGGGARMGPDDRTQGGKGLGVQSVESGTLSDAQQAVLASMAEEEKLAHDLYTTLSERYPDAVQLARIASAETRHLDAVRTLLERYGIADPTAGLAPGEFASAQRQAWYDDLLAGATSGSAALAAGVEVERADIADLDSALSGVTAPDVVRVLSNLRRASQHHLTAFGG